MKLSVVLLFCDKDFNCLEHMVSLIEKYILASHEIILVDNRNNQLPFETKYKYISKGKNCYILEGRRMGLAVAEGDYVWFVDVDDEIIDTITEEDLKDRKENILQIPFKTSYGALPLSGISNIKCFGTGVWCRLYKTEILKHFFSPIKRDIKLVNGEDNFILNAMLSIDKTSVYVFNDKYRYLYNNKVSAFAQGTKESLERSLVGEENLDYLYSFLPQECEAELNKTKNWNKLCRDMLNKLS